MSDMALEIEAKNVDEAIEKACREFNVPREKLNIEILAAGSPGILGIGAKKARIKASLLSLELPAEEPQRPLPPAAGEAGTREREKAVWPERPESRHSSRAETKPEVREKAPPKARAHAEQRFPDDLPAMNPLTVTRAKELLEGILSRMGLDYPVEAIESEESVTLNISGDGTGLLIGRGGQTLDAIQYIINKIINKERLDRRIIVLDTEEYRGKREEYLLSLASKLSQKVKRSRKPVTISNMSARDRRIIHLALKDDPAIMTKSRGEGAYRKIVILPSKKEKEPSP